MLERLSKPLVIISSASEEIDESIRTYVGNGGHEAAELARLGRRKGSPFSFNAAAAVLGSLWYSARGLWGSFILLLIAEAVALFLLGFGLVGDLGSNDVERAHSITATIDARKADLQEALSTNSGTADALTRNIDALEVARTTALRAAEAAQASRPAYIISGVLGLLGLRILAALLASRILLRSYEYWRSNRQMPMGFSGRRLAGSSAILLFLYGVGYLQVGHPNLLSTSSGFWQFEGLRASLSASIDTIFQSVAIQGEALFEMVKMGVTSLLTIFEAVLVQTPLPIVYVFIVLISWHTAGRRVAILTAAALAYLILFGFWEKAMMTTALLGTAALICVIIGIPVGVWCGRNEKVFSFIRPILDLMQTMPSFVYLIPVIAFFGTGKTPAIIATITFGMPPVIRLTTLGIRNVPHSVREAAVSFGASRSYLLWNVDLPLAAPSIMAGVNQTLLLCLSMVVVASLIGAKGLGEDVLIALQYAASGDGVLAGLAILCCAIVFDRVVQGKRTENTEH